MGCRRSRGAVAEHELSFVCIAAATWRVLSEVWSPFVLSGVFSMQQSDAVVLPNATWVPCLCPNLGFRHACRRECKYAFAVFEVRRLQPESKLDTFCVVLCGATRCRFLNVAFLGSLDVT